MLRQPKVLLGGVPLLFGLVVCVLSLRAAPQDQPQARFRGGIDLVVVDVTVLDKTGAPIPDLRLQEFQLEVDGRKREVVAAEFVSSQRSRLAAGARPTPESQALDASIQPLATAERSIVVAVDVENIRSGEGRIGMEGLADYIDTLPSTDRIGVAILPFTRIDIVMSSDRTPVRNTLTRTFGRSQQSRSCEPTVGEAAAWAASDDRGLDAYLERAGGLGCRGIGPRNFSAVAPRYRAEARKVLENLAALATSMAEQPGRRAVFLVSEGLYSDEETRRDVADCAAAFERARVVLYAIHLDVPYTEAVGRSNMMTSRRVDDQYGLDAMSDAASATGGTALRAISRVTPAMRRIDTELSGSYVLAFERNSGDRAGKPLSLRVKVTRKDAEVRARSHVTIKSP